MSDRISYPKLFRIVNSFRQGFVQGDINVTWKFVFGTVSDQMLLSVFGLGSV